ncbi:hypothetical protein PM082_022863 [Marasmius tenuissimus]|nr:hypothetical protein PM082_022863 [Marasmius tenuissimus]
MHVGSQKHSSRAPSVVRLGYHNGLWIWHFLPSEQISTVAFYLPDIVNNGLEMLDIFLGVSLNGNRWDAGQIDKVGNEGIVSTKYARGSDAQKPDLALAR